MRSHGVVRFGVLVAVLGLLPGPGAASAQERDGFPAPAPSQFSLLPAAGSQARVPPEEGVGHIVNRAALAAAGAFTGLVVTTWGGWVLAGESGDCDLCWEVAAAGAVGGILGGALATTLADGEMPNALVGSVVGAAAGSLLLAVLDRTVDMDGEAMMISFAIPYSFITAYLARP